MAVLTISRESGSEGSIVGKKVARTLGYHYVEKESIGQVMSRVGLEEFDREYDSALNFWDQFDVRRMGRREEMVSMLNRVLLALARHGNIVIVGRCGFVVLQDYADVLNVRFQAPFPLRVERMMGHHNISDPYKAEAFVRKRDRVRADFVESFYGEHWITPRYFDLIVDTGKITVDMAAEWLSGALKDLDAREMPDAQTTADIRLDERVHAAMCEVLDCEKVHKVQIY